MNRGLDLRDRAPALWPTRRIASVVVALPCRTWPIVPPSIHWTRLHQQSLGLNTFEDSQRESIWLDRPHEQAINPPNSAGRVRRTQAAIFGFRACAISRASVHWGPRGTTSGRGSLFISVTACLRSEYLRASCKENSSCAALCFRGRITVWPPGRPKPHGGAMPSACQVGNLDPLVQAGEYAAHRRASCELRPAADSRSEAPYFARYWLRAGKIDDCAA